MLYAKSLEELQDMLVWLMEELLQVGLQLNGTKSKILTTMATHVDFVDIRGEMFEVIDEVSVHKYLGRHLTGDLDDRGPSEAKHRIQAAWHQFHKYQKQLTNKNVSVKLRLKLFDAVVSPCLLFGMAVLPLYQHWLSKIDTTQRKMIRHIVGWIRMPNEMWEVTMRRMKLKVATALCQWDVKPWSARIAKNQWLHAVRVNSMTSDRWAKLCARWEPARINDQALLTRPSRDKGRPYLRWDDNLSKYCGNQFGTKWYDVSDASMAEHIEQYCDYVGGG